MFRRRALLLIACAVVSATLACGGREPITAAPATAATATPTITLTAVDCTADQLAAVVPAHLAATLVNKTSSPAMFAIHRILEGHAYGELEMFIAEQQRRFVAGEEQLSPPSFTIRVTSTPVESKQTASSETTLPSGTYGLVCREQRTPNLWPAYLIGPFRVP